MGTQSARATLTIPTAIAMILAAAAASAQQAAPAEKAVLGEVVVTAQKRAEALADIPMSVSVLAGDSLERQQVNSFEDMAALVPGLSLNSNTPGITRVTMRGINTGGVSSTVGVYVNEVPFGSSSGLANAAVLSGDFDTFDMARVEVLRGPQGTLYGASSLGGVIKYVTNAPSTEGFEGRLQASAEGVSGADMGYNVTGMLNMPVSDSFAIRASGFFRNDGGYTKSIGNSPILALQDPTVTITETQDKNHLNGSESTGGRISALFKPSDTFSLDLTVHIQSINSDNANTYEVDPVTLEPLYGDRVASRYQSEPTNVDYRVYSATLDWDLGGVSLESVTSYSEFSEQFQRDVAAYDTVGLGVPTAQFFTLGYSTLGTTDRLLSGILVQTTATDKFTQEFRLLSPDSDRFEWLLGAYYTDEDSGIKPQRVVAVEPGTNNVASDVPDLVQSSLVSTYKEIALFGNATWHVTDRFDLSFGARWSDNDQEAQQDLTISVPAFLLGGAPGDPNILIEPEYPHQKSSESPVTWSFSPRYEFTDTTSAYLRVATGFRPGGPNVLPPGADAPPSYDSDELTNYEVGLRTGSADGSFALDIAAFFLDWKDIQLFQVINGFGVNANGGTAESQGLEFTATTRTGGLSLTFSGAYTDTQLTEDTDPLLVGGFDGDALPFVPEWTLALGGDYEWSAFGDATAYVGGQVAYTGERPAGFNQRVDALDPTSARIEADAYTTVDLRTGVLWDKWSLELYGKNLTDERGLTDIVAPGLYVAGAGAISAIRPCTIGLSIGLRF